MPVVQIAQIRVRRGAEIDIPALDPGEFCLALDTGRLFIGFDPDEDADDLGNLEILTEESTEALNRAFDVRYRDVQTGFITSDDIDPDTDYATVTTTSGSHAVVLDTVQAGFGTALVNYTAYDGTTPMQTGVLTMLADDTVPQPMLTNDCIARPVMEGGDPTFGQIGFRAIEEDGHVVLQCVNGLLTPIKLVFRIERAQPPSV